MNNRKVIFCILGKSSVGKDTLINRVTTMNINLSKIIPITTRPPRRYEKNGHDYHFTDQKSFMKMIDSGNLMEHRKYDVVNKSGNNETWFYGTAFPKSPVSILTGSLVTYEMITSNPKVRDYDIYPIYITIPDEERLYRMILREKKNWQPNYREVARRFLSDNSDFSDEKLESLSINDINTFTNMDIDVVTDKINRYINEILNNERIDCNGRKM